MNEKTQQCVITVLNRMLKMATEDVDYAEMFSGPLDDILDEMLHNDAFGTEGSSDPRGDQRNGEYSMWNVEGNTTYITSGTSEVETALRETLELLSVEVTDDPVEAWKNGKDKVKQQMRFVDDVLIAAYKALER